MPPEWNACARQSRVCPCYTTWCAPIIRCRSASLAVVRPNHRLSGHSTMRRASAMLLFRTQSAAVLTSLAPHGSKARLLDMSKRRDSWRSHVHCTYFAQRVQFYELQTANVRGQGARPLAFSWGSKGAILSRERMAPLSRAAPKALPPLRATRGKEGRGLTPRHPPHAL